MAHVSHVMVKGPVVRGVPPRLSARLGTVVEKYVEPSLQKLKNGQ